MELCVTLQKAISPFTTQYTIGLYPKLWVIVKLFVFVKLYSVGLEIGLYILAIVYSSNIRLISAAEELEVAI